MGGLVFKSKKRHASSDSRWGARVRADVDSYNKVLEVADETGETLKSVVSKMIDYAYDNIVYEDR